MLSKIAKLTWIIKINDKASKRLISSLTKKKLENVTQFEYLGSPISNNGDWSTEIL
jgi:hypothetical protein